MVRFSFHIVLGPTRNLENSDTLTKYFSLEMSSNRTSEADLQKPSIPESIDPSIYHQFTESRIQELKLDEIKTQTLKSEALMRLCKG